VEDEPRGSVPSRAVWPGARTRQPIAKAAAATLGGAGAWAERARRLLARLSDRERQVALAVGRGGSNAGIGRTLSMSVLTVKAHLSRILTELDLINRVQVALLVCGASP